ncbi:HTH-type transcriptional regulator MetR [Entomobacter blattae]|uniref:HTH-type transcriptional regulator MetR n=2 Tax=Entomobacter blattae TaxID=2762277 RepID=A0A7H1NTY5_9PROT|nr:HTH-type transcriptional regulator MetR [Entomobacter blattae]
MLERIHLEIIYAIEQCGSLTAAAEKLCLTQSALSHTIKKLEQLTGTIIWTREGRSLRLTQTGLYLRDLAKRIVPQMELAEEQMQQYAQGKRGILRIGVECHPCYQWLQKVVNPYLKSWSDVDIDIKQKFNFGGIGALLNYEIDLLVTPDPLWKSRLSFLPVFDYEQVLVVGSSHPLASFNTVSPKQLSQETLITYPVEKERLDIFSLFLTPAGIIPKEHKTLETTEIIFQMVENQRGISAMPLWLVQEYSYKYAVTPVRLGKNGIFKSIYLGTRKDDLTIPYLNAFIEIAKTTNTDSLFPKRSR